VSAVARIEAAKPGASIVVERPETTSRRALRLVRRDLHVRMRRTGSWTGW
jgi:hypothetical protein